MRRKTRGRVYGPYEDPRGWRVVAVSRSGERVSRVIETEAEAQRIVDSLRLEFEAQDVTVSAAIDEYLVHKRGDVLEQTAVTIGHRLRDMFDGLGDEHVGELGTKACQAAYDRLRGLRRVDTHRNTLTTSRAFLGWCRARGYAETNALEGVVGQGRRNRGKEQLRIDESRKLLDLALELGAAGDASAVAVATVLIMGIRASECIWIQRRDIDDGGRLLWIPKSKTQAGVRKLEVPEVLRPLLKGVGPDVGHLFPDRDRHWVLYHVRRICRLAGVPEVCTHGLRGTQSTLSRRGGASAEVVAAQLGHASTRVQDRHYVDQDVAADARNQAALHVLRGDRT